VEYSSGEENIGSRGRKMRKALSVVLFSGFLLDIALYPASLTTVGGGFASVFLLYGAFYCFIQSEQKFCGTFGFLGLKDTPDGLKRIQEKSNRLTDLSKSMRQNAYSIGASLFIYIWVLALAI